MITHDDIVALSRRVRDLLDAEIATLGIKDTDYVRRFVAEDIDGDIETVDWSEDLPPPPPMPPEGDPSYSMAVHGPRSEAHLIEELERRMEDVRSGRVQCIPITREYWEEKIRKLYAEHGLEVPSEEERHVRFTMRMLESDKEKLARAASVQQADVKDFVLRSALQAANALLEHADDPLTAVLEASMAMEDQAMPITPQLWQDMKRKFFEARRVHLQTAPPTSTQTDAENNAYSKAFPPTPPEGDPSYHPAIHGARSPEHLMQLIEEGFNSGSGQPYTRELLEEIKQDARRMGLVSNDGDD